MSLPFDETKATQVAVMFLQLRGGRMHYLKLIKLLYLVDRTALLRWGIPVTTDRYVSMDNGPVLSRVYNLITDEKPKPVWSKFISPPMGEYEVELLVPLTEKIPTDRLSRAEENLIHEIFEEFGRKGRWELVRYAHTLPEWKDPEGSAIPISIRDILEAGGEDEEEIRAVIRELHSKSAADEALRNTY